MRVIFVAGLPQQRQNAHYEIQLLVEQHNQRNPQYLGSSAMVDPYAESQMLAPDAALPGLLELRGVCGRRLNRMSRAVDATRLLDGVLPRAGGWHGEEAARQTYGAYAPPVGSQPPAAEPAVPGVEPAAPGVAAPAPAAAAGAQTRGAAPLTYAPDYAAAPPGVTRRASCTGAWRHGRVRRRDVARRGARSSRPRPRRLEPAGLDDECGSARTGGGPRAPTRMTAALATPGAPVPPAPGSSARGRSW